jgi:hypothetical protein
MTWFLAISTVFFYTDSVIFILYYTVLEDQMKFNLFKTNFKAFFCIHCLTEGVLVCVQSFEYTFLRVDCLEFGHKLYLWSL